MQTTSGANIISSLAACDDAVLIEMTIAGRSECFSVLMDRHLAAVKKRVRSMVSNDADLEDVIQEVQLKAWRHLSAFRLESNLRTWIMRIAINEACQLYRSTKRSRQWEPLNEAIASLEESPDQRLIRAEASAAVRRTVRKLPRRYQEVLVHRDLSELGGEETAKRLNTTVPAVKTRLFRARVMLFKQLRNSGKIGRINRTVASPRWRAA